MQALFLLTQAILQRDSLWDLQTEVRKESAQQKMRRVPNFLTKRWWCWSELKKAIAIATKNNKPQKRYT